MTAAGDISANPRSNVTSSRAQEHLPAGTVGTLAVLLVAAFTVTLNETITNVALKTLMADLHVGATTVQWLASGYLLTLAIVVPTTGFLLRRLSPRTAFIGAMSVFTVGTVLAAVAPVFPLLLAGRIVQACGTAVLVPLLMTTILTLVPASRRGSVIGIVSIAMAVAPATGPTIAGVVLEWLPWRFLFVFVVPVAVIVLVIGARRLSRTTSAPSATVDAWSVVLTMPAFGGLVFGLSQIGGSPAGGSAATVVALAVGVAALLVFVLRQVRLQRVDAPLLDLRAFRYRMFTVSVLLMVVSMTALFAAVILLPLYLQGVRGVGTLQTGLLLLPGGLVLGVLAVPVGRVFDRVGPLPLSLTGALLMAVGLWLLGHLAHTTPLWEVVGFHVVLSAGLALVFTPAYTGGLNPLPPQLYAHGSAIMNTAQQVAGAAGTALLVSVYAAVSAGSGVTAGTNAAFRVAMVMAVGAVVLSLTTRRASPAPDRV